MAIIKHAAELCDYVKVLPKVKPGSPVYLTVNGCTRYVIRDIADDKELEEKKVMLHLLLALNEGRLSGEMDGWISENDVRNRFHTQNG